MKLFIIIVTAVLLLPLNAALTVDWKLAAAQAASNIVSKISGSITSKTNSVRKLATPENYALLKSNKLKDAAKKLALQKELAEAVLLDEEQSEAGRLKWHGAYVGQRIDLENLTATFVHADGTEYTVKFQKPNIIREAEASYARLPNPPMTNGVPRALASARERRYVEKTSQQSTVTKTFQATTGNRPQN